MVLRADDADNLCLCHEMSGQVNSAAKPSHKEAGKKHISDDELAVQSMMTCFRNWVYQFETWKTVSSGRIATEEITTDLLGAQPQRWRKV